ncbi:4'-phosphopantetheinyl transferase family protein [Terasakiella pusilla]|uniref:4'-phosphopantetheinyl transferase family protein n=1 Tax=Terasakiella pusilla TaxID=64973 RepID=UPI003AA7B282
MQPCTVWVLRTKSLCSDRDIPVFISYLNAQERSKAQTFRTQALRESYVVSRGFTKWVLAQIVGGGRAAAINIHQDEGGKPYVVSPQDNLDFNVSHCPGMVVVACGENQTVGVDVEPIDQNVDLSIADRHFCASETLQITQGPSGQQADRFFEFWTLKEAYLKALGIGLSGGLAAISFELQYQPRLSYTGATDDSWSFNLYQIQDCKLALCRRGGGGEVRFLEWCEGRTQQISPRQLGESIKK